MSNSVNKILRDIARQEDDFFGRLEALQPVLAGLVPDDRNFSGDSYDELFVLLTAAYYLVTDPELRRRNADRNGGNPKLASVLLNEGPKDKDAHMVGEVLDRIAAYVHPVDFVEFLIVAHASEQPGLREFRTVLERMTADLWRIASGFEPAETCPEAFASWAAGPHLPVLRQILFKV